MIDYIEISGFKSIRKCRLEFGNVNVMIGSNGAGKSNLLSFFELVHSIFHQRLGGYSILNGGADHILFNGSKVTDSVSGMVCFNDTNGFKFELISDGTDKLLIKKSSALWNRSGTKGRESREGWYESTVDSFEKESNLKVSQVYGVKSYVRDYLYNFGVYHFHDTGVKSKIRSASRVNDNIMLDADGANLAAYLYRLQKTEEKSFAMIEAVIKLVAPYFKGFLLNPDRINSDMIRLEWESTESDQYFNAMDLSDGTIRFIALATLLLQSNPPKTIVIDEPELGLHPTAINLLYEMVKKASNHSQVIIATQSPNLLALFDPQEIITVDREDGQSVFKYLDGQQLSVWLEEYNAGDLWLKNIIDGQI